MRDAKKYRYLLAVLYLCWYCSATAQTDPVDSVAHIHIPFRDLSKELPPPEPRVQRNLFVVGDIYIAGNKKTKPYIIKRELPFASGDSVYLPQLIEQFETARQQLMNTSLFNEVVVALKSFRGYRVDIAIEVKERWYIFPVPYVKPVDRNLSEWARQGYGLDRLNYGFKFMYNNVTGRNDKMRIWLVSGYTRQIQFQYEQPYADKTLKHGYKINFGYSFNREVNYATQFNQQQFIDSLPQGIRRWNASFEYLYRPGLRTFHGFRISYNREEVDPRVVALNPKYFNTNMLQVTYPEFTYTLNYFHEDYIPYPLKGLMAGLQVSKRGISKDMNMWHLSGKISRNWAFPRKTYFEGQAYGDLRVPFDQPFINQRLFGYGDQYLRGLENYVIDGVAGFLTRSTLRHELCRFNIPTYIKSYSHDHIPFRIYAKIYTDAGYVYNKTFQANSLVNRFLYTAGFGIDVVTFYDFVFRLDYSFNQLGENGLFLHIKSDF